METKTGLEIRAAGQAAVASFTDSSVCDVEKISDALTQLKDYIKTNRPRRMVFDFSNVKFFSSQVLGLLLETRAGLEPQSGQVAISALSPQLHRVFQVTNLDGIFSFYDDIETALSPSASAPE